MADYINMKLNFKSIGIKQLNNIFLTLPNDFVNYLEFTFNEV